MKRFLILIIGLAMASGAVAQEFNPVPRAWKWINEKEVLFSYDGSFADTAAFAVDARTGKQRTGVSAPARYASFPVQPERAVNLTYSPDSTTNASLSCPSVIM